MSAAFNPKDKIRRFHHVALEVSDMAASINFYCDVFGYQLTEQHEASEVPAIPVELAFLRLGENHHDMVLSTDPTTVWTVSGGDMDLFFYTTGTQNEREPVDANS